MVKVKLIVIFIINTIIGVMFFSYIYFSHTGKAPKVENNLMLWVVVIAGFNVTGFCINWFNKTLNVHISWKKRASLRLISGLFGNYIVGTLILFNFGLLCAQFFPKNRLFDIAEEQTEILIKFFILAFVVVFLYVIIDFAIYTFKSFASVKLHTAESEREQGELQLEALRSQLSPHYLYNNLNTISMLVYKSANLTEKYIRKLAGTYKYILNTNDKNFVRVGEELDFVEAYSFLLSVRHDEKLSVMMNIQESDSEKWIPPLSIQILIENAVKHNAPSEDEKLFIEIFSDNLSKLFVKNNILRKDSKLESFKIGLSNLRRRYAFFTDRKIEVKKNKYFSVAIPMFSEEPSVL